MAQRTVPRLQDVLVHVTKTPAAAFAAGVSRVGEDGHYEGLIHVAFSSEEAQSFIEWVMRRATPDELAALAEAEERRAE
ncbi:hypothetical protein [Streptomyces sp. NPDC020607]|uniref:hypothetical protein n=1 Tax=Streptomyces sp. NPDC020607 TaxID=3365082 RepID=UPI00378BB43D